VAKRSHGAAVAKRGGGPHSPRWRLGLPVRRPGRSAIPWSPPHKRSPERKRRESGLRANQVRGGRMRRLAKRGGRPNATAMAKRSHGAAVAKRGGRPHSPRWRLGLPVRRPGRSAIPWSPPHERSPERKRRESGLRANQVRGGRMRRPAKRRRSGQTAARLRGGQTRRPAAFPALALGASCRFRSLRSGGRPPSRHAGDHAGEVLTLEARGAHRMVGGRPAAFEDLHVAASPLRHAAEHLQKPLPRHAPGT
jgi:hypothetical protein